MEQGSTSVQPTLITGHRRFVVEFREVIRNRPAVTMYQGSISKREGFTPKIAPDRHFKTAEALLAFLQAHHTQAGQP